MAVRPVYIDEESGERRVPRHGDDVDHSPKHNTRTSPEIEAGDVEDGFIDYDTDENRAVTGSLKRYLVGMRDTGKKINTVVDLEGDIPSWFETLFSATPKRDMLGYNTVGDGGGDELYWDADRDKQDHDGGMIFSPTHSTGTFGDPTDDNWHDPDPNDSGSGCWVRMKSEESEKTKILHRLRWYGLSSYTGSTDATIGAINAKVMNYLLQNHGGFQIDDEYYYTDPLLIPNDGARIKGSNRYATILRWGGESSEWAIRAESYSNGSYENKFDNFRLLDESLAREKQLLNLEGFRYSSFKEIRITGGDTGLNHGGCWNNLFVKCRFEGNTKGARFGLHENATGAGSNSTIFKSCRFSQNDTGIEMGDVDGPLEFINCGIENNSIEGVAFRGDGQIDQLLFEACYIEFNSNSFVIDKAGFSGAMRGVRIEGCYIIFDDSYDAGLLYILSNNSGGHSFSITDNTFNGAQGAPINPYLFYSEPGPQGGFNIHWHRNRWQHQPTDVEVIAFDGDNIDWRYVDSDVSFRCTLNPNVVADRDLIELERIKIKVQNGIAHLTGMFQMESGTDSATTITEDFPFSLEADNNVSAICYSFDSANTLPDEIAVNINTRAVRVVNAGSHAVNLDVKWRLNNNNLTSSDTSTII